MCLLSIALDLRPNASHAPRPKAGAQWALEAVRSRLE
jgi:hypothetical protein